MFNIINELVDTIKSIKILSKMLQTVWYSTFQDDINNESRSK